MFNINPENLIPRPIKYGYVVKPGDLGAFITFANSFKIDDFHINEDHIKDESVFVVECQMPEQIRRAFNSRVIAEKNARIFDLNAKPKKA